MNDARVRELLAAYVSDVLPPEERSQVQAYLAQHPHLEQEAQQMRTLFDRVGAGSAPPPPEAWSAIEAAIAKDAADAAAPRIPTPVQAPRWRKPRQRLGAAVPSEADQARAALLFGKVALNWRLISRDLLNRALHYQQTQAPHLHLGEILLEKRILTREQVEEILAYQERIQTIQSQATSASAAPMSTFDGGVAAGAHGYASTGGLAEFAAPAASSSARQTTRLDLPGAGDPSPDHDPLLGSVIGGCTLKAKIGAGAMGAVYLASHEALHIDVVVKLLPPEAASNPRTVERFFREARASARLEHSNVVAIKDVGTTERGLNFIVMQYIEGQNLEERILAKGKHSVPEALDVVSQIAKGLRAAHQAGVIHRDVKAENILVTSGGVVKVTDFGLAKDLNSELKLTADGAMIGTPLYMAPEIGRVKQIDGRVDLYSLGVTFYYLLTGVQPFRGFSALDILSAKAHDKLKPPELHLPEIQPGVRAVLGKMLAKDRDERYADMDELLDDLARLERGLEPEADARIGPWPPLELTSGSAIVRRSRGGKGSKGKRPGSGSEPASAGRGKLVAALVATVLVIVGLIAALVSLIS